MSPPPGARIIPAAPLPVGVDPESLVERWYVADDDCYTQAVVGENPEPRLASSVDAEGPVLRLHSPPFTQLIEMSHNLSESTWYAVWMVYLRDRRHNVYLTRYEHANVFTDWAPALAKTKNNHLRARFLDPVSRAADLVRYEAAEAAEQAAKALEKLPDLERMLLLQPELLANDHHPAYALELDPFHA